MKRTLIALGVAATVALPVAAQAAPKVYGRLNLSVESYTRDFDKNAGVADNLTVLTTGANTATSNWNSNQDYTRLLSNASRFGVKGEDELTASLSAVYQIEWEVAADMAANAATSADLKARNRFVGIKSVDFGTLKLGAYDTYTKLAQGEIDLFNDLVGDMQFVIAGENRISNVAGYESPKFFDALTFNVLTQTQDAGSPSTTAGSTNNAGTTSSAGQSASVVYNAEDLGLYVALGYDNNINSATALYSTRSSDQIRLVASYKLADLTLNGIYGTSKAAFVAAGGNDNKETGWQLGASYKIGDELIKLQYGVADADNPANSLQKRNQWSVGVDHNLTAKTRAFFFYTTQEEERLLADNASATKTHDNTAKILGLGIDHKF